MKRIFFLILCAGLMTDLGADAQTFRSSKPVIKQTLRTSPPAEKKSVELSGGTPEDFISLLSDAFPQENIHKRASFLIPTKAIKLPTLRVHTESAEKVLLLYNRLSEGRPEWGEWIWEGDDFSEAAAIVLVERKDAKAPTVRAATPPPTSFTRKLRSAVSVPTSSTTVKSPAVNLFGGTTSRSVGTATTGRRDPYASGNPYFSSVTRTAPVAQKANQLYTRVFATGKLDDKGVQNILIAVNDAMLMLAEEQAKRGEKPENKPRLRYHPGSKAVIAVGTQSALQVVEEVISAISKSVDNNRSTVDPFNTPRSNAPKPPKPARPTSPF